MIYVSIDGNIHRIFVCEERSTDKKPVPTHVISQRDVLRFLMYRMGLKPTTIEQLQQAAAEETAK